MDEIQNCILPHQKHDTILILDKLAQLRRSPDKSNNNSNLQKRARAKFLSIPITLGLLNNNPKSTLKKSYWNTYHCNNSIIFQDGTSKSKYCKNRWCLVCSRIKTATAINSYLDVVKKLEQKQFVTLTIKNVKEQVLSSSIDEMRINFLKIINKHSNRKNFKGLRKLEVTYNPIRDDYHPHYHIIVSGKQQAELLLDYWLYAYKNANIDAQKIQSINDDDEHSLIELFKYATKIIQKDIDSPKSKTVYFNALDVILRSLKGKRIFQPFGIKKLNVDDNFNEELENISDDIDIYQWEQELSDWISHDTGELLSQYKPSAVLSNFVNNLGKKGNKNG